MIEMIGQHLQAHRLYQKAQRSEVGKQRSSATGRQNKVQSSKFKVQSKNSELQTPNSELQTTNYLTSALLRYCATAISFLLLSSLYAAGGNALNINKGARASVFGDSFVGVADETSAIYYNPAGLAFIFSPELIVSHDIHISENSLSSVGFMRPDGFGVAALAVDYFTGPQLEEFADGAKKDLFSYYTADGNIGYGVKLTPALAWGLNIKYVQDTIGDSALTAYGADAGMLIRTLDDVFSLGVSGKNLYANAQQGLILPKTYLVGFSFKWTLPEHYSDVIFALGYNQTDGQKPTYTAALEHFGAKTIGLRLGYKFVDDEFQRTAQDSLSQMIGGLSIRIGNVQINYSYQPLASLGDSHRMDIQWRFFGWDIKRKKVAAAMKAEPALFSPNGDGAKDSVFFIPEVPHIKKPDKWELTISNIAGTVVRSYSDKETFPKIVAWDGNDSAGKILPEGTYNAIFTAYDRTSIGITKSYELKIDLTPPVVSLSASTDTYSISEDTSAPRMIFYPSMSDLSGIDFWQITVQNERKKIVKTFMSTSAVTEMPWDAKDDYYGAHVPDGRYLARLTVVDNAGNRASHELPLTIKSSPKEVIREVIKEVQVKEDARGLIVSLASHVLFEKGKYELKPQAKKSLDEVIEILNAYPENKVRIEGHTDSLGNAATNKTLSSQRAWGVYSYLVKHGVEPSRLSVKGMGADHPIATNKTEEGRAKNRRVEIIILKK